MEKSSYEPRGVKVLRPGRDSHPRIAVLQTAALTTSPPGLISFDFIILCLSPQPVLRLAGKNEKELVNSADNHFGFGSCRLGGKG